MEYKNEKTNKKISTLEIPKSCKAFYIKLSHTGKLASSIMGHNLVVSRTGDMKKIVEHSKERKAKGYLPKNGFSGVLATSNVVLGSSASDKKVDYIKIDTTKINKQEKYKFYCTFIGHSAMMQGDLKLI